MSQYSPMKLTNRGKSFLLTKDKLIFTKMTTTFKNYTEDQINDLESIEDIQQTNRIFEQTKIDDFNYQVEALFTNDNITSAYKINTIAIYIQGEEIETEPIYDEDDNLTFQEPTYEDILYGIATAIEPLYIPSPHQNRLSLNLKLNVYVNDSEVSDLNIYPDTIVTQKDLLQSQLEAQMESAIATFESLELITALESQQSNENAMMNAEIIELMMTLLYS